MLSVAIWYEDGKLKSNQPIELIPCGDQWANPERPNFKLPGPGVWKFGPPNCSDDLDFDHPEVVIHFVAEHEGIIRAFKHGLHIGWTAGTMEEPTLDTFARIEIDG